MDYGPQFLPMTGSMLVLGFTTSSWVGLLLGSVGIVMIVAGLVRLRRGEKALSG